MKQKFEVIDKQTPKEHIEATDLWSHGWFEVACVATNCINNRNKACYVPTLIIINKDSKCNAFKAKFIKGKEELPEK